MTRLDKGRIKAKREIIKLFLTVIFGVSTVFGVVLGVPSIPVQAVGGTIDFRYPLFVFILYTVAALMLGYIHTFEEETGYSIISKPQLRVHIDSTDKEAVRRSLYEVSKKLAAVIPGSGRSFDIGTNIEDKFPRTVSLALNFYGAQTDYVEPKKSARCLVDLDNMMLSFYCGRRGHREPFELLENSVKDEFSKQGIKLAKKPLVALRPS